MRIKEGEEKEGRVCCNKLEFLLLHNKQTNEGFHRLISLSLSLFLWFTRSSRVAPFLLVFFLLSRVKTTLLSFIFMKVPFLILFFFLSSLSFLHFFPARANLNSTCQRRRKRKLPPLLRRRRRRRKKKKEKKKNKKRKSNNNHRKRQRRLPKSCPK